MKLLHTIVLVILALLMASSYIEATKMAPAPAPAPTRSGSINLCDIKCQVRCSKASRKSRCLNYCGSCCAKCNNCVPSGTYGNRDECPCYRDMLTRNRKPKCP